MSAHLINLYEILRKPYPAKDPDVFASRLAPSILVLAHSGSLTSTSEPSQVHLKTSLLPLIDGSLASKPEVREGKEGRETALF